jgi:hypothetical protein
MYQNQVTKQPNSAEETRGSTARNCELASSINSSTSIICGDLLRCLFWCCCCLTSDNNNSNCNCCSDECYGCENCDCSGCDC